MREVRPWLVSYVSLGQFETKSNLRIVDCTSDKKKWPFKAFNAVDVAVIPWEPDEYESVVWGDIGYGMSRPIQPEDSGLSYVPTQIIAECLRDHGVDGIAYGSLLAKGGVNVALFDTKAADLTSCGLMETSAIQFTFGQSDNPYFSTATRKSVTPA